MKNFIAVFINDGEHGKKGEFKKGFQANSAEELFIKNGSDFGRKETIAYLEVAEEIDIRHVEPVLVEATHNRWEKDGFETVYEDPQDETWTFVAGEPEHYEIQEKQELVENAELQDKTNQVKELYDQMNEDVYTQMEAVFGTKKSDSATAYHETWKQMVAKPELYATEGLTADREVLAEDTTILFDKDEALDTEQKITTYATRLLEIADAYSVYRLKRIQQFRTDKESVLA